MKKYNIIYADPPWRYERSGVQGAAEKHYPTMAVDELCKLPVSEIAADDSILFLWATFPQLREALQVIRAWGFSYKSVAFVWLKQNKSGKGWFYGLGYWTRGNSEICLLATKGHPKRQSNRVHQFIISPLRGHSQKPDEARDKIIELVGDLPRVELFAREKTGGWDVWGNEVDCDLEIEGYRSCSACSILCCRGNENLRLVCRGKKARTRPKTFYPLCAGKRRCHLRITAYVGGIQYRSGTNQHYNDIRSFRHIDKDGFTV